MYNLGVCPESNAAAYVQDTSTLAKVNHISTRSGTEKRLRGSVRTPIPWPRKEFWPSGRQNESIFQKVRRCFLTGLFRPGMSGNSLTSTESFIEVLNTIIDGLTKIRNGLPEPANGLRVENGSY